MLFANHELARRLEAAEAFACAGFAQARAHVFPDCGSEWTVVDGATVVFDGVDAPTTQTFGLGIHSPLTESGLDRIEAFFRLRGAAALQEVCPFAGAAAMETLCRRGYRPLEISNVLFRSIDPSPAEPPPGVTVRVAAPDEADLWSSISARGWTHEHPELAEFVRDAGRLSLAREDSPGFLAESDGIPGAAGVLVLHRGVALFGGAATVPELRRRGLQSALLAARMRYAAEAGCDLAMMVAEAGSNSQRNAERQGFRVAYTRIKWALDL